MRKSKLHAKVSVSLVTGLLPMTAGTFFLATATPSFAHGAQGGPFVPLAPVHTSLRVGGTTTWLTGSNLKHNVGTHLTLQSGLFNPAHTAGLNALPAIGSLSGSDYKLDLSSASASIVLGSQAFGTANSVTIAVGGSSQTFKPGQFVTAGEFVAIQQVLAHIPQTITLDAHGTASGGSFSLNQVANAKVDELLIPSNVTAVDNISSNKSLSFAGDLISYGSIDGISTSARVHAGSISAVDIINEAGASISTNLAGTSLASTPGAQKQVDLTLTASNNLTNNGTISSSGALTLASQGGSIINTASVSAGRDVTIVAGNGNLANSGTIQTAHGNINISSGAGIDLNLNATGGTYSAINGNINLRDASYTGGNNINIDGGNYLSNNLNIYAGSGAITGDVGQVTGKLNTSGDAAHFIASTDTLTLGSNCLTGDPTFVNTTGNIVINGGVVAGESITILAAGNITASGNAYINTANAIGLTAVPQTAVTLVAGAKITTTGLGGTTTLPGAGIGAGATASIDFTQTGLGGNIDLSKSTHVGVIIDTSSILPTFGFGQTNGGSVTLAAVSTNATNGRILFPAKTSSIDTSSEFGVSGSVQIIAGNAAAKTSAPSISINNIKTHTNAAQLTGSDGKVSLFSGAPDTNDGLVITWDSTGAETTTNSISSSAPAAGYIQLTGGISAGAAAVQIGTAGAAGTESGIAQTGTGRIQSGDLMLTAGILGIGTKTASILTNASGNLSLFSTSNVFVNNLGATTITAGGGGAGGTFQVTTTADSIGNGNILLNLANDISSGVATPLALINLNSTEGAVNIGHGGIDTAAGSVGNLFATTVTLADGVKGTGGGVIGLTQPVQVEAANLSANTRSIVQINNLGPVNLLASSAGGKLDFILATTPRNANDNASITLSGKISSSTGVIAEISLTSSEGSSVPAGGGIIQKTVGLTALGVLLSDNNSIGGPGNANFGTAQKPFIVSSQVVGANSGGLMTTNIKDTNTGTVGFLGESGGSLIFSSAGSIECDSATGPTNLTLQAGGSAGNIYLLSAPAVTAGTLTITAAGKGSIQNTAASEISGSTVILNAKGGSAGTDLNPLLINATTLQSNVTGFTNIYNNTGNTNPLTLSSTKATNQFTLLSDGPITVNLAASKTILTNATGIKLATTTVVGNGDITYDNSLGGSKTQTVELIAQGTGNISSGGTADILTASNMVNVSSGGGTIGNTGVIEITAPNVALNTNENGSGAVLANIIGKNSTNLLNSSGGTGFTLSSNASLTLNNLFLGTGNIQVTTSGALLQTGQNSLISLGNSTTKAATGQISLLNTNTAKGSIFIGANSQFSTLVTAAAPEGSITILIGTTPSGTAGTAPTNVSVVGAAGTASFGVNSIVANAPNNVVNLVGANVTFDTNGQPASRITLGGGTTFTADPPVAAGTFVAAPSLAALTTSPLTGALPPAVTATAGISGAAQSIGTQQFSVNNGGASPAITTAQLGNTNLAPANINVSSPGLIGASLSSIPGLAATLATVQNAIGSSAGLPSAWLSDTELSNGAIPAAVITDIDLGIASDQSAIVEIEPRATDASKNILQTGTREAEDSLGVSQPLQAGVRKIVVLDRHASEIKSVNLKRGAVVFAPTVDTAINTRVGKIILAARSLALVIAFNKGVAVFNLDDNHKDSIKILSADKTLTLAPGQHATITSDAVRAFTDINPAQLIGHRGMGDQNLGFGLKVFRSEFSVLQAIFAVQPLKNLMIARDPQAKKIAGHLLKTTSILQQMTDSRGSYTNMVRPNKVAWQQ